jgi:hypothetical protein
MSWLGTLWSLARSLPTWIWGALAAVGGLLLAYLRGRGEGAARERAKQQERALQNRQTADRIEREVEGLSPSELDERGSPWVRR